MDSLFVSELYNYIDKGGVVLIILLFFSIISLSIIFFKLIQLKKINNKNIDQVENKILASKDLSAFIANKGQPNKTNPYDLIVFTAATILKKNNLKDSEKISEISIFANRKVKELETLLPSLEIISQVSPLIGLLGTVIGMISSFNQLEIGGSLVDPAVLAGGIWTALLTTAAGLIVAIPAMISHYFFEKKISVFQDDINHLVILLNNYHK